MSMFYCALCDGIRDVDEGCEETSDGLRLICVDCADDPQNEESTS